MTQSGKMPEERIVGVIVIHGSLENRSPLHIGCGMGERTDRDLLLDEKNKPFIPATSLIGVLRHAISPLELDEETDINRFWGYAKDEKNGLQSMVRCSDLPCETVTDVVIRDGVKIDNRLGRVEYAKKFDTEILEPGARFRLNLMIRYTSATQEVADRMAATLYDFLKQGFHLGANANNGFGDMKFMGNGVFRFSFSNKRHVMDWLLECFTEMERIQPAALGIACALKQRRNLRITADLALKRSLIVRSYPAGKMPVIPESRDNDTSLSLMPDAVQMTSAGKWVVPATSLKGAIRARAERIAATLGKSGTICENLFGCVDGRNTGKRPQKGRIRVREMVMDDVAAEVQHRIRIDRFTGGVIEGALFDSMPLFRKNDEQVVQLVLESENCTAEEAQLLLMVLKDLWTGDLAVGGEKNVGRGVFIGKRAVIEWGGQAWELQGENGGLSAEAQESLQKLQAALLADMRKEGTVNGK